MSEFWDEVTVRNAIELYPKHDIWGSELFHIPVKQLEKEFGDKAFNAVYLELMYDNLGITRRGDPTTLRGIVVHALRNYKYDDAERQAAKSPEQIKSESNNHWFVPNWNPCWEYTKFLLRIFQSDPRTRTVFENMVSDQVLGI